MSFIAGIEQATEKLCWYARTLMLRTCRTTTAHSRRMLKKARLLTRPTLAVISPARPESAKTASLPRDAPYPMQGRSELSLLIRGGWDDPNCARPTRAFCGRALREQGDRPTHPAPFSASFLQP